MTKDKQIRDLIIVGAKKLFQQYGLAKTTMEDIAREIGKGKSSLYYYYATKEEIFEAVILREKERLKADVFLAVNHEHTADGKLRAFARTIYRALKTRKLISDIVNGDTSNDVCLTNIFRKNYDSFELDVIRGIIAYGIENGEFKASYREDLDEIAFIGASVLRGLQVNLIIGGQVSGKNIPLLINTSIDLLVKALKH